MAKDFNSCGWVFSIALNGEPIAAVSCNQSRGLTDSNRNKTVATGNRNR